MQMENGPQRGQNAREREQTRAQRTRKEQPDRHCPRQNEQTERTSTRPRIHLPQLLAGAALKGRPLAPFETLVRSAVPSSLPLPGRQRAQNPNPRSGATSGIAATTPPHLTTAAAAHAKPQHTATNRQQPPPPKTVENNLQLDNSRDPARRCSALMARGWLSLPLSPLINGEQDRSQAKPAAQHARRWVASEAGACRKQAGPLGFFTGPRQQEAGPLPQAGLHRTGPENAEGCRVWGRGGHCGGNCGGRCVTRPIFSPSLLRGCNQCV